MATVRDFKLTTAGDWDVSTGDLVLVSDLEAIAQHIRMRVSLVLGEWFLDELVGVDIFGVVLVKNPNINAIRAVYRKTIIETPGVVDVLDLATDYDSSARTLTVSYHVKSDLGVLRDSIEVTV